ncbi:hypothetical protein MPLB_1690047 [Mesorhizobium sp. ORS 3324]|nr:hypothetical protein MPLB_1690047 [Mesorhizobium sp. ORS 3324]
MQKDLNTLVERQVALVRKLGNQAVNSFASHSTKRRTAFRTIRTIFSNRIEFYLLKFGLKTLLNIANAVGSLMVLIVGGYLVIRGQTTIALDPDLYEAHRTMGDVLRMERKFAEAAVAYEKAVEVDRNSYGAMCMLWNCRKTLGDEEEAHRLSGDCLSASRKPCSSIRTMGQPMPTVVTSSTISGWTNGPSSGPSARSPSTRRTITATTMSRVSWRRSAPSKRRSTRCSTACRSLDCSKCTGWRRTLI